MSTIATPIARPSINVNPAISPEDLLQMEEKGLFELADSILTKKKRVFNATEAVGKIVCALANIITGRRLGKPIDQLFDGDLLAGEPALPGFSARVTELLPAILPVPVELPQK